MRDLGKVGLWGRGPASQAGKPVRREVQGGRKQSFESLEWLCRASLTHRPVLSACALGSFLWLATRAVPCTPACLPGQSNWQQLDWPRFTGSNLHASMLAWSRAQRGQLTAHTPAPGHSLPPDPLLQLFLEGALVALSQREWQAELEQQQQQPQVCQDSHHNP